MKHHFAFYFLLSIFYFLSPTSAEAATLSLSPPTGNFAVGSTFDVGVKLDTEGETINAVSVALQFAPDKLQLVSPAAGRSIIGIWAVPPRYDNQTGTVVLQGLAPGGIKTANGLVTTLTFRARAPGQTVVKFLGESDVLLHDGAGSSVLRQSQNGIYRLILPPPQGPLVVSDTHPDQFRWYNKAAARLSWSGEENGIRGFSYMLNNEPADVPDNILEGDKTEITYRDLADGIHYFHIKALRGESFGGTTHFRLNIDTAPPAEFPVEIIPSARTTQSRPMIQFFTSDALSGVEHYELKIIPLAPAAYQNVGPEEKPLFIEAQSPYVAPDLAHGEYDVVVRAYDAAGNYRDVAQRLSVVNANLSLVSDKGLEFRGWLVIPWVWIWLAGGVILIFLLAVAWLLNRWHRRAAFRLAEKQLPPPLQANLDELKKYFQKYGKVLLLCLSLSFLIYSPAPALAREESLLVPAPLITTAPSAISNEEIFYLGGRSGIGESRVLIYLQNMATAETWSYQTLADEDGEWFYIHNSFLPAGRYVLWAQSQMGDVFSPPGPRIELVVQSTAWQFGASRLSVEIIYLLLSAALTGMVVLLILFILNRLFSGRRKHRLLLKEIREAEESVKRGFAILRRDISAELGLIKKARLSRELSAEEKTAESQLLQDLQLIERHIGKEIWDIEKAEAG